MLTKGWSGYEKLRRPNSDQDWFAELSIFPNEYLKRSIAEPGITVYHLQNKFDLRLAMRGVSLYIVAKFPGHSSIAMVEICARLLTDQPHPYSERTAPLVTYTKLRSERQYVKIHEIGVSLWGHGMPCPHVC